MSYRAHAAFAPLRSIVSPLMVVGALAMITGFTGPPGLARADDPCASPHNPSINPADFKDQDGRPNPIDNPYFPLKPGTTFIYEGKSDGESERGVVHVTHRTRMILEVPTVVVRDQVSVDRKVAELTFDWFAQDKHGNVWYFGEIATFYDSNSGEVDHHEGSWEAGREGAKPGIVMEAQPNLGDTYHQEQAPDIASAMATVVALDKHLTVPYGSFEDVLLTRDFNCLEPEEEHKYYARNVGLLRAVELRNGRERTTRDVLDLVSITVAGDSDDEEDEDDEGEYQDG